MPIPKIVAGYRTQLADKLEAGDATVAVVSLATRHGNLENGTYALTIDEGGTNEETLIATLSGSTLTIVTRDVSVLDGVTSESAGLTHRRGAEVKITDFLLIQIAAALNGDIPFDAENPLEYDDELVFTSDNQLVTKKYVDDVALLGAPVSGTSTLGVIRLSVAAADPLLPVAVGTNDGRVPTQGENDALAGTSGTPSSTNKYVTDDDTGTTGDKVLRLDDGNIPAGVAFQVATGSNQLAADDALETTTSLSYTKLKEIVMPGLVGGTVSVTFTLERDGGALGSDQYGRIYVNGVAVGTERSVTTNNPPSGADATYTEDIAVSPGDAIQIYAKCANASYSAKVSGFKVKGNIAAPFSFTVN